MESNQSHTVKKKKWNVPVEGIMISILTGWFLASIIWGNYKQIFNRQYPLEVSLLSWIFIVAGISVVIGIVYYIRKPIAKVIMFFSVYIYMILCALESFGYRYFQEVAGEDEAKFEQLWLQRGYDVDSYFNNFGSVILITVLCGIMVLVFLYVKEDLFSLFQKIKIKKWQMYMVIGLCGIGIFLLVMFMTVYRYKSYMNSTYDFGLFAQMFAHMRATGKMNNTVELNTLVSHLGIHFSPIFYVVLPIYYVFPSVITLDVIQALLTVLPIIPILLLSRKFKFNHWITMGIVILYSIYPAVSGGSLFDIHENSFLTFLILMVFWAIESDHTVCLIIFTILTLFVKEDASFNIMIIGLYYLVSKKAAIRGSILSVSGVVYFFLSQKIIEAFGMTHVWQYRTALFTNLYYNDNSDSMFQIIYTLFTNPAYTIGQIASNGMNTVMPKIEYICIMLIPILVLLFSVKKNYSRLILLIPFLLFNLLTTYNSLQSVVYQYNYGVCAMMIFIMMLNIKDMDQAKLKTVLSISLICTSLMFCGTIISRTQNIMKHYQDNKSLYDRADSILSQVPEDASVAASNGLIPHLSKTLELYDILDTYKEDIKRWKGEDYEPEMKQAEYVVVYSWERNFEGFEEIMESGDYRLMNEEGEIINIYQRVNGSDQVSSR